MTVIDLPEKDYFSRQEIAERWGCDVELINYYIKHGLLHEALHTENFECSGLQMFRYFICTEGSDVFKGFRHLSVKDMTFAQYLESIGHEKPDYLDEKLASCPRFVYLKPTLSNMLETFVEADTSVGYPNFASVFSFLATNSDDRYIPIYDEWENEVTRPYNQFLEYHESMDEQIVIPKEERDRFEREHSGAKEKELTTKTKNAYLKTINALSRALIDGLTGVAAKDANALLTALDLKGIEHPVTAKTLASYLQESNEL